MIAFISRGRSLLKIRPVKSRRWALFLSNTAIRSD